MKFNSRASRGAITLTVLYLVALVGFEVWVYFRVQSSFLPAVINSMILIFGAINLCSVPRFTRVGGSGIEICCVLDITHIPYSTVSRVRLLDSRGALSWSVPVLGLFGFLGYYGLYFSFRRWRFFKCYTRSLVGCAVIERTNGMDLVVSLDDLSLFAEALRSHSVEVIYNASSASAANIAEP